MLLCSIIHKNTKMFGQYTFFKLIIVLKVTTASVWLAIMSKSTDIHGLILARGGSKGVLNKNLMQFNGISLLGQTISTLKSSMLFASIWVSTDSKNIENEAVKYGALVHRRHPYFAQDQTSSLDSVKEFLEAHSTISRFALFQCTSYFLNTNYIAEAYEKFKHYDCVFSVKRSYNLRWNEVKGKVEPLNFDPKNRPRRQEWNGELIETGMFYFSTRQLVNQNHFQNERCATVEIKSEDSLEIDTYYDVQLLQCILKVKN